MFSNHEFVAHANLRSASEQQDYLFKYKSATTFNMKDYRFYKRLAFKTKQTDSKLIRSNFMAKWCRGFETNNMTKWKGTMI